MEKKQKSVFDWIAPIYDWFYNYQVHHYQRILEGALHELDLSPYKSIVDIGCGTGALCYVLSKKGLRVTGVDASAKMLQIAAKKQQSKTIEFIHSSALKKMPFEDKSFDISIASFVAHGLREHERKTMYAEMSRITKYFVLIYDYNDKKSIFTSIIEWFEGGDYFNFIRKSRDEMEEAFDEVHVINVSPRAACTICKPL